jgi:DNA-binding transcriptional MerR regulator
MVRKHSAWARSRMTRSRPKTPAPTTGWVISELSQITGMSVRRLRDYVARDLITPLERRGTATRYQREQLVRLVAIKRLRAEEELDLGEIKRRMNAMGERELEAWILTAPLPEAVLTALGTAAGGASVDSIGGAAGVSAAQVVGGAASNHAEGPRTGNSAQTTWHHVELLPGLVLQVSANASPAVKSAAKRICDEYVGG